MLPGKDKIIQCPTCDHRFRQQTIVSGNTLDAKIWTDGKQEAPMMPEGIVLSFCNSCNNYFWVENAEVIEELDPWDNTDSDIDYLDDLNLKQYIDALGKIEIRSQDDTLFILRQIWWNYNDYYRKNNEAELSKKIKDKMPDLLEKLLNNFDEDNDEHLMLKGELLRELQRFEAAEKTLNQVTTSEYLKAKDFILDLVKREVAELKKLNI